MQHAGSARRLDADDLAVQRCGERPFAGDLDALAQIAGKRSSFRSRRDLLHAGLQVAQSHHTLKRPMAFEDVAAIADLAAARIHAQHDPVGQDANGARLAREDDLLAVPVEGRVAHEDEVGRLGRLDADGAGCQQRTGRRGFAVLRG